MNRNQATELIREMSRVCGIDLEQASLIFSCKTAKETAPGECELHILTAELNEGSRTCLYALMDQRGWKFKEEADQLIVLESKK